MLIKVKAFPCQKEEEVIKSKEDSFEVKVREKPERGLANQAVLKALSDYFNIPQSQLRIIKGFRERNKIIEINGV